MAQNSEIPYFRVVISNCTIQVFHFLTRVRNNLKNINKKKTHSYLYSSLKVVMNNKISYILNELIFFSCCPTDEKTDLLYNLNVVK